MQNPKAQIPNSKSQVRSLRTWVLGLAMSVLGCAIGSAQSLGDVAKREEARRKQVNNPAKVYTNDDLRGDAAAPAAPSRTGDAAAPKAAQPASPAAGSPPTDSEKAVAADPKKTEAYWKDRLTKARSDLDRARTFADALQS